jgi:hypothetical protein
VALRIDEAGVLEGFGRRWSLGAVSEEERAKALADLRATLREAADAAPREADGASTLTVRLTGSRAAKWRHVQAVMEACSDPSIRIYRVQIGVPK